MTLRSWLLSKPVSDQNEVTGLLEHTLVFVDQADDVSDASLLFGVQGLRVARVESDGSGGRLVQVVTDDETASACPICGVFSQSPKGRVCTRPRDIPYGPDCLRVVWSQQRWRCREWASPRGSFTEALPAVRARSRLTTRLSVELGFAVAEQGRVVSEAAAHYGMDWSIAHASFVAHVDGILAEPLPPVTVLGDQRLYERLTTSCAGPDELVRLARSRGRCHDADIGTTALPLHRFDVDAWRTGRTEARGGQSAGALRIAVLHLSSSWRDHCLAEPVVGRWMHDARTGRPIIIALGQVHDLPRAVRVVPGRQPAARVRPVCRCHSPGDGDV